MALPLTEMPSVYLREEGLTRSGPAAAGDWRTAAHLLGGIGTPGTGQLSLVAQGPAQKSWSR